MNKKPVNSISCLRYPALLVLTMGLATPIHAQPGNNSPNQFGDRQNGQWGDPGQGHFGNPAAGDFDKSQVVAPQPGAKPLGRVYNGKPREGSPYISLPAPTDAAPEQTAIPAETKKPAKKRAKKKKDTN